MGEADVRAEVGRVLAALREAGRSEGTIRRHQVVLDRLAAFLAGRGLVTASDQVRVDFIANQTGIRLGSLREPVRDRDVKAIRRPVVLMADALAGRAVVVDKSVIPAKDGCPARFRPLRDDYVVSCRARGNAEATVATKDKAVTRFLGYLDEAGVDDLAALGVRDVSGFFLRQRGLRRKTIAAMRSLADFLAFLAAAGRTPQSLAGRRRAARPSRPGHPGPRDPAEEDPGPAARTPDRRRGQDAARRTRHGQRTRCQDTVLLALAYDTAARVQELCDLDVADIRRGSPMTVVIHGKGSKIRYVPVMEPTAQLVAGYFEHRDQHPGLGADADPLFPGPNHSRLTRSRGRQAPGLPRAGRPARDPG